MTDTFRFLKYEVHDDVAVIGLDDPDDKVNKLTGALGADLDRAVQAVAADPQIRATVIVSRKESGFVVGADIKELHRQPDAAAVHALVQGAQDLLNRIASSAKPFVAAIHGPALGGGLELALACHWRVATDHPQTQVGLPEVKLGLVPAAGGTQRLPRLIGVQTALDLLLTGKSVFARKAKKLGLVDDVVIPFSLTEQAVLAARRLAGESKLPTRERSLTERAIADVGPARDLVFNKAAQMVAKQSHGHYPAPPAILDCVRTGLAEGMQAGLAKEVSYIAQLLQGDVSRSLMHLFFAMNGRKKMPQAKGVNEPGTVGVLGAGLMGAGIATVTVQNRPIEVLLKDVSDKALAAGMKTVYREIDRKRQKKAIGVVDRDRRLSRVAPVLDYDRFARAGIVVEAVFENLELKQRVLAEVEAAVGDECVFASNTSALPIGKIAAKAKRPENVLGMHYFSPVPKMPLLEIITTDKTSAAALGRAVKLGLVQGKTIIVVKDGPGFYTTRILIPYLNEAGRLLLEGARIEAIDAAATDFGFPVGPITLFDEIGIDVAAHVNRDMTPFFAERGYPVTDVGERLFAKEFYGRKNKKGFYLYDPPAKPLFGKAPKKVPHEAAYELVGGERRDMDAKMLGERVGWAMINEAVVCLADGVIAGPEDGDLGAILGLGFPPFRGGPFRLIDAMGVDAARRRLEELATAHGEAFRPASLLDDMARANKRFYSE